MKYYKSSDKNEFIDFFPYTESSVENNDKEKDEENFIPLMEEKIEGENEKIRVKVNHREDIIESIDIECSCGNKSRIIIDYNEE